MNLIESIEIRELRKDDREKIINFFDNMTGETRVFFNRYDSNKKNALKLFDGGNENKVDFVAVNGNEIIGYLFLWDLDTSIPWLGIGIDEKWQGQKLGRRLMSKAVEYAKEQGKGGILLSTHVANTRAQGLYLRMGFVQIGYYLDGEMLLLLRF